MPRYSTSEKTTLLEAYLRSGSCDSARRVFAQRFPLAPQPPNSTILRLLEKFRSTGSLCNVLSAREPYLVNEEKLTEIQGEILAHPTLSVRKLSQQVGICKTTVHKVLRNDLGLYPFRATVTHQLLPADHAARVHFCEWYTNLTENVPHFAETCYFSDEAWFYLDGFVNSQNSRQWNSSNPHLIVERPLHPLKVGVWAAMSSKRIFILFFDCIVDANAYQRFVDEFVATFTENDIYYAWFQQDNAPAHTAKSTLKHLEMFFGERVISRGLWPARSPDLSPSDYFLWGYLKERVYQNCPRTVQDLRMNILSSVQNISSELLHNAVNSLIQRANLCIQVGGQHFQHL